MSPWYEWTGGLASVACQREEQMNFGSFFSTQNAALSEHQLCHQYLYSATTKTHGDVADSLVTHAL
jgi:hypothetical protein